MRGLLDRPRLFNDVTRTALHSHKFQCSPLPFAPSAAAAAAAAAACSAHPALLTAHLAMPKQRHDHSRTLVMNTAADIPRTCTSQQAAAAWAWLQHGGGSCITPRRAEGLMAANLTAKCKWSRPSRFKMELIRRAATMQEDIAASVSQVRYIEAEDGEACCSKGQARRRHSFHVEDLAGGHEVAARVAGPAGSFSARSSTTDETWSAEMVADHDDEHWMKGYNNNLHGRRLDEASSLLDEVELEAVWKQLHQISTTPTSMSKSDQLRPAAMAPAQKPMLSPLPELKPRRRHYRSIDDISTHKKWRSLSTRFHHQHTHHHSDDQRHSGHHQYAGHLLHQILRFRSGRTPAYCSSIATVNSIVDHHQSVSPKKFRGHTVVSLEILQKPAAVASDHERCSTDQQIGRITKQSGEKVTVLKRTDEGIAADLLPSSRHSDLQVPLPQLVAAPAATSSRHHSYSKLFQSLTHRQPQSSHVSHESASLTRGNSFRKHLHFHDHQHYHYHHHHHHHRLYQLRQQQQQQGHDQQQRAVDAALQLDPSNRKVDVVSGDRVQRRKLVLKYSVQKSGSSECTAENYEGGQLQLIAS